MIKPKLIRVTTVPISLNVLLKGQLRFLDQYFNLIALSSPGKDLEEVKSREGVEAIEVNIEREISIKNDIASLRQLIKIFKKEKPQMVHANTPKGSLLSMIAAKYTKVPVRIYTVTGLRFEGFEQSLKRKILVFMERLTCKYATHVIPEGNGVKQVLIQNNITNKPLEVIGNGNINGVDSAYFSSQHFSEKDCNDLRNELGIQPSDFTFCFVGRLVIDKGVTELIAAFKALNIIYPNAKLLLIGPIEKLGNALNESTINEIEQNANIINTGFINDIRPYLSIADVFTFPSYREGFPNVVLQAGAMDLPCIVTNINGSNEIIVEGKNGIIIPLKDENALMMAMENVIKNKVLLNTMKSNSRKMIVDRFEQNFVWTAMLKRYNEYLRDAKIVNK